MKRHLLFLMGLTACTSALACGSSDNTSSTGPVNTGGAGNGGGSNGGGANGGGGNGEPTFPTNGEPITAPDNTWQWVDFPDTFCRDGSTSGLSVSLNAASDKVMIYLQGGGACFDPTTCLANPANDASQRGPQTGGIFDRTNAENPVKDWNFVFIPYCTGDIFGGTNETGTISGLPPQKFVGRKNMEHYLNRIVPTFPKVTQVLLTGISAGGFGAATNADLVSRAFGTKVQGTVIDDSGPSMSSQYLPKCLQDQWRTVWGFDDGFLKDCGSACPNHDDYALDYTKFLAGKYADRASGLVDSNDDSVITLFYGYGQNDCTGSIATPVPAAQYDAALQDMREQMKPFPNFYTYFPAGVQHTWLGGANLYTYTEDGVRLIDWVTAIVQNKPTQNVGK